MTLGAPDGAVCSTREDACMSKLEFISLLSPAVGSFVLVMLAWMNLNSRLSDLQREHEPAIRAGGSSVRAGGSAVLAVDEQFDRMDARLLPHRA